MAGSATGILAAIAGFYLLLFLWVGVGRLLGDNYWLSALILGGVFGGLAFAGARVLKAGLRETVHELEEETALVGRTLLAALSVGALLTLAAYGMKVIFRAKRPMAAT